MGTELYRSSDRHHLYTFKMQCNTRLILLAVVLTFSCGAFRVPNNAGGLSDFLDQAETEEFVQKLWGIALKPITCYVDNVDDSELDQLLSEVRQESKSTKVLDKVKRSCAQTETEAKQQMTTDIENFVTGKIYDFWG